MSEIKDPDSLTKDPESWSQLCTEDTRVNMIAQTFWTKVSRIASVTFPWSHAEKLKRTEKSDLLKKRGSKVGEITQRMKGILV